MKRARWSEIAVLLFCVSIPCYISYGFRQSFGNELVTTDFGVIYFGARSGMHHSDPYEPATVLREFQAQGGRFSTRFGAAQAQADQIVLTRVINLPTTLFLAIPFASLPWGLAQNLWMVLTAALLVAAAFLTWGLGAGDSPLLWAALAGFMLADSHLIFQLGNVAGIVASLCVISAWCFLKDRCIWAGVLLLAISLVVKPQDSGFVWLYFLVAGGALRKRALLTLAASGILAVCAALWITHVSPHWVAEMHKNMTLDAAHGGLTDPGPAGFAGLSANQMTDLQAALSFFKDDPHFYNPVSYLICGVLILVWGIGILRKRFSLQGANLALAAIAPLSLLPVYHRAYDGMLLLLAIPACVMLWKEPGAKRWVAVGLTSAGILLTSTSPLMLLYQYAATIAAFAAKLPGRLPTILLLRPAPIVLLAMACFYLWACLRYNPSADSSAARDHASVLFPAANLAEAQCKVQN